MNSDFIKEMTYSLGADVCGIANIQSFSDAPKGFHPLDIYPDSKSIIVFGKQFPATLFEPKTYAPYTFFKNKIIEVIDNISIQLTINIEAEGFGTIPIPSDEPYDYWDSENKIGKGILSLKHAAQAAGIGSMGKNTLLINESFGNRLWLGAVITSMELTSDAISPMLCPESCELCLKACPKSALDGITVNQKRCREICGTCTDGGGFVYGCNLCRKVCPFAKTNK